MVSPTKNNQSHREDNNNIEETQKLFNALGSNFLKKERQNIRQKLYVKETIDKYLKELEEKGWRVFKRVKRRFKQIKKISIHYY